MILHLCSIKTKEVLIRVFKESKLKKATIFPENFSPLVTSALIVIADLSEPWLTRHISNYFNWSRVLGEVVIK